jgi:hypothetical protein
VALLSRLPLIARAPLDQLIPRKAEVARWHARRGRRRSGVGQPNISSSTWSRYRGSFLHLCRGPLAIPPASTGVCRRVPGRFQAEMVRDDRHHPRQAGRLWGDELPPQEQRTRRIELFGQYVPHLCMGERAHCLLERCVFPGDENRSAPLNTMPSRALYVNHCALYCSRRDPSRRELSIFH